MLRDLALCLPDGRVIVSVNRLTIEAGTRTLLSRPSGSGKSTLFRAIAGIWPYGRGTIDRPAAAAVLLLPQRPYIPSGTLKTAVTYPSLAEAHSDEAVRRALELALWRRSQAKSTAKTTGPSVFPVASSSVWRSRGLFSTSRIGWSSMRRHRRSTSSWKRKSTACWARSCRTRRSSRSAIVRR